MPDRRQVLFGLAAVSFARPAKAAALQLRAAPGKAQLAPKGYGATDVWAFNGSVPGTTLRGTKGGRMRVAVENGLSEPTSVHWHGLRLENPMDGVPGVTQDAIAAGASFDYDFRLPDAGTYWYHSHSRSFEQVARGLYGPLIVDEPDPPDVDADEILMLDDWRLVGEGAIAEGFGAIFDKAHGGRIGNWVTVNGQGEWKKPVPRGSRIRLRLINAANGRIFGLHLSGMTASVVALDGQPTPRPLPTDTVSLAPAQRVDLIADISGNDGGEAVIASRERDGDFAIASFPIEAGKAPSSIEIPTLPSNNVPLPSQTDAMAAPVRELRMEGGAMGRMREAEFEGESLDARTLASRGMAWSFNGMAGMPEAPFAEVRRGETVRIALINDTSWPHAMHLHGHHFLEFTRAAFGSIPNLRDTTVVAPNSQREIVFVADNPGDWLLHCHMLEHAAAGMMTWLRVT